MSTALAELRQLIEQRFPDATPLTRHTIQPVATGLETLDAILPGGGLPRGKFTVWTPLGGAIAVLRSASHCTMAEGERAAWVDTEGTAGPQWAASHNRNDGPLLVRPHDRTEALRCAEVLLRCGGFSLVVLTGAEPEGTETVRLTRAVREGGGAFVALTHNVNLATLRISSRILPHGYRWIRGPFADPAAVRDATIQIQVRTLGWNRRAEVVLPVTPYDLRMSLDPTLPDRRGGKSITVPRRRGR